MIGVMTDAHAHKNKHLEGHLGAEETLEGVLRVCLLEVCGELCHSKPTQGQGFITLVVLTLEIKMKSYLNNEDRCERQKN